MGLADWCEFCPFVSFSLSLSPWNFPRPKLLQFFKRERFCVYLSYVVVEMITWFWGTRSGGVEGDVARCDWRKEGSTVLSRSMVEGARTLARPLGKGERWTRKKRERWTGQISTTQRGRNEMGELVGKEWGEKMTENQLTICEYALLNFTIL